MRPTNSLHSVLNNSAGRPSGPAALMFLRLKIPTLISSWLGGGIFTQSSSMGFGTTFLKAVFLSSSPCSGVEKCFLHRLSTPTDLLPRFHSHFCRKMLRAYNPRLEAQPFDPRSGIKTKYEKTKILRVNKFAMKSFSKICRSESF